jgi:hypothetical protein
MTTATAEKTEQANTNEHSEQDTEKVITFVANDLLKNATVVDLLSGVPVNTLIQLLQNQSISRAKQAVDGLSDEEFKNLLESANNSPEVTSETAGAE